MNRNQDPIDELFRSRLEHYSPEPPPRVWDRLSSHLEEKALKARPVYYQWSRWAAAAAVLLVALVTGLLVSRSPQTPSGTAGTDVIPIAPETPAVTTAPGIRGTENLSVAESPAGTTTVRPLANGHPMTASARKIPTTGKINEPVPGTLRPQTPGTIPASATLPGHNSQATPLAESLAETALSHPAHTAAPLRALASLTGWVKTSLTDTRAALQPLHKVIPVTLRPAVSGEWIAMASPHGENDTRPHREPSGDNWSVGMVLTPAYSSFTADHSADYARNMTHSASHSQASLGAGISVSYKASPRWRIESGMFYSRSGDASENSGPLFAGADYYDFENLAGVTQKYFNTTVTLDRGEMAMNSTAGVITFTKTPSNAGFIALPESYAGVQTALMSPGTFYQVFDFMEIPLTARYRLIDQAIALELISGVSTHLVVGNAVWAGEGSAREQVGKTADISTVNMAGTLGLGILYPLGNHLSLSVEPRASYFLNSMNHSGEVDFRPWKTALYTGLTWNF